MEDLTVFTFLLDPSRNREGKVTLGKGDIRGRSLDDRVMYKRACVKLPHLHSYWFVGWNLSGQQVTPIGHQGACAVFRLVWTAGPCRVCSSVIGVQEEEKK